jgi:hypothetical protein
MRRNPVLNNLCQYSVTGAPITLLRNGNRHCSGEERPVMLSKTPVFSCIIASFLLLGYPAARADTKTDAALLKALDGTQVTLEEGLKASEIAGEPISAKFEIEDGRLQLSVYTTSSDGYREVLVSMFTGVLMSAQKITDADDLAAARVQSDAIRAAKVSLRAATEKAATQSKGSRSVSVTPELLEGRPVAKVTLVKAGELTTVNEDIK